MPKNLSDAASLQDDSSNRASPKKNMQSRGIRESRRVSFNKPPTEEKDVEFTDQAMSFKGDPPTGDGKNKRLPSKVDTRLPGATAAKTSVSQKVTAQVKAQEPSQITASELPKQQEPPR